MCYTIQCNQDKRGDVRKIIHVDMDCFYAAIEMRDKPYLKNLPVAVGGQPSRRGVLCTCNYVAREFGVHSAMATAKALQLCPNLVVLPVNMALYKQVSQQISQILGQYTDKIEPLSLDEAYLDVSESSQYHNSASLIAAQIRKDIYQQTELSCSAGISVNKYLAKIASDWNKPNGQFLISPQAIDNFLIKLPLKKLPGVGRKTNEKLKSLGYNTCGELQSATKQQLSNLFGKQGIRLYQLCRGIDEREVVTNRMRKSVSVEHTYEQDLNSLEQCLEKLTALQANLENRLTRVQSQRGIHKQFVKLKWSNFIQTTVECVSSKLASNTFASLLTQAYQRAPINGNGVRLLGIGVRFEANRHFEQLSLFE